MKQHNLSVRQRKRSGRGHARRLRQQGEIPAIVYGKSGSHALAVSEPVFRQLMRQVGGSSAIVEIKDDAGNTFPALIQDIQRNPATDAFIHVDFLEVDISTPITTHVHVVTHGEAVGVKAENGVLEVVLHMLDVRCLPNDLPEHITVDIEGLHAGESIHIRDLPTIPGVEYLGDPDNPVISCSEQRVAEPETEVVDAEAETAESDEGSADKPESAEEDGK